MGHNVAVLPFRDFGLPILNCSTGKRNSKNNNTKNKKVLLRERKRHTVRRVSSTPCAVLSWGRGYPITGCGLMYPTVWDWGSVTGKDPWKGHGTSGSMMGWRWGTHWKVHGTSGSMMGWRWGTPPPRCEQTDTSENSTFPSYYVRGWYKTKPE